ncbi:MAG: hypothetical protein J6E46_01740 [Faecalicoccus sp.]|nr:hypothetical protein [Faecalicoccus sp.]
MKKKKNNRKKSKVAQIKAVRGIERQNVINNGGIWMRPTSTMKDKTKYDRNNARKETRKEISEY